MVKQNLDLEKVGVIVFVCPHKTLGDTVILADIISKITNDFPQLEFMLFADNSLKVIWEKINPKNTKVRWTRIQVWPLVRNVGLSTLFRRIQILRLASLVFAHNFINLGRIIVIGPDWFPILGSNNDLFSSLLTRLFSKKFCPRIEERRKFQKMSLAKNTNHRESIAYQLSMIGLCSKNVIHQSRTIQSRNLSSKNTILDILLIGGAGRANRDWVGKNGAQLKTWLNLKGLKKVDFLFMGVDSQFTLTQTLQIIQDAKVIITNDTGWAHVAISKNIPLICLSSTFHSCDDHYIPRLPGVTVIRPKKRVLPCTEKCEASSLHCMQQITIEHVGKTALKLLSK